MIDYIFDITQGSEEWLKIKEGKFTGTCASDLLMDDKCKGWQNLIKRIAEERFTGESCESDKFSGNKFTERGLELEPVAILQYEFESFNNVTTVGFVQHSEFIGCSPDGLINDNGLIQVKCPIFNTMLEYHKDKTVPTDYFKQMQFELFATDREYNIFYAYHPKLQPFELKIYRCDETIKKIETAIEKAGIEIAKLIEYYHKIGVE